ncbi:MAG: GNAT family N-acetyltransferase [Pseudomonadota bacterium]
MTDRAFETHPLTPERWPDLEDLFGARGASGGCWCMLWRLRKKDWTAGKGDANRDALRARVQTAPPPGVLGCLDGRAVGWCSVAPRAEFTGLAGSRILSPVDDRPVWSVTCFFFRAGFRRKGLSVPLLNAAADLARDHGAEIVEGYPIDPGEAKYAASFAWTGFRRTFEAAGFREVARRSEKRPIMRRVL